MDMLTFTLMVADTVLKTIEYDSYLGKREFDWTVSGCEDSFVVSVVPVVRHAYYVRYQPDGSPWVWTRTNT